MLGTHNGGLVHALHCFFDDDEGHVPAADMLECRKATGSKGLIQAHEVGQRELKRFWVKKYDDLSLEQEEAPEGILDEALDEVDDGEPFEIRLASYARMYTAGSRP